MTPTPRPSRFGRAAALALAGWFLAAGPPAGAAGDPDRRTTSSPGLELVPADAPGFVSVRVADLFKSPGAKEMRQALAKLQPDFRKEFRDHIGVSLTEVERCTFVLSADPKLEPVAVVTTAKPFSRDQVVKAILKEAEESRLNDKRVYVSRAGARAAVYFAGNRVFVAGSRQSLTDFLGRRPRKGSTGPLSGALDLAAGNHLLVAGMNGSGPLVQQMRDGLKGEAKALRPLFSAKSGALTLVSDADTRVEFWLRFADEGSAKEARQALPQAKKMILDAVAQAKKHMNEIPKNPQPDEFSKWVLRQARLFLNDLDEAVRNASVKSPRPNRLEVILKMKTSANGWLGVAGGWFKVAFSARMEGPPVERATPPPPKP